MARSKPTQPVPQVEATLPLGAYLSVHRESALVVQSRLNCVWFLGMHTGKIEVHTAGPERFARNYPIRLPDYPLRRAVRVYNNSEFDRDDLTQKVMDRLLETPH